MIDSKQMPTGFAKKIVKSVYAAPVKNQTISIEIPVTGSLTALRKVELFAEVQGIFKTNGKLFKEGESYKSGETLIRMDGSEFYASIRSRRSDLFNLLTGAMPDLRLDYPSEFPKWEKYLAAFDVEKSTPDLPEFSSDQEKFYISGKGIVQTYYSIKNLEERHSKYIISAPFNGILTEALVNPGSLIRSGQKLGEFIDPSVYEMEVAVNKSYLELLEIGKEISISDLEDSNSWVGKLSRINGKIDQATQTVKIYIQVSGKELREGMYLKANLKAASQENAIEISRKLLLEDQIYIVKDTILSLMPIKTHFFSDKTAVVSGVPDGTVILTQPILGAYDGMIVHIIDEKN